MMVRSAVLFFVVLLVGCNNGKDLLMAEESFDRGEFSEAADAYSEYVRLHPNDTKALYNRGRSYEEMGEQEKALSDFRKVLELDEKHIQANTSIAMYYYFKENNYAQAIEYLNTALSGEKKPAKAYTLRGKSYQRLGAVDKAMKDYNNAISEDDAYADAYYARGSLKIFLERNAEACRDFQIASGLGLEEARKALDSYCK